METVEQKQKYYLVEAAALSNVFKLRGKSLRCYEVTIGTHTNSSGYARDIPVPTGKMYTFKNGKIQISKTNANLQNKYVWNMQVRSSIDTRYSSWSSMLYTSPELAIGAKVYHIHKMKQEAEKIIQEGIKNLEALESYSEAFNTISQEHPEYFI